jgi:hypothetical protein
MRPNMIRPNFDVRYGDHLVHIGNARYLLCGEVDGTFILRIQECQYQKPQGGEKQPAKMIRFTIQQWMDLMDEVDAIGSAMEEFDKVQLHIGGNTYVRVQPQRHRIDIREFFLPDGRVRDLDMTPDQFDDYVLPTRRGISLTYDEWTTLIERAVPLIEAGSERLKAARRGSCLTYHHGQLSWLKCTHCNPNGYLAWVE